MKKVVQLISPRPGNCRLKFFLIMKFTAFLILVTALQVSAKSYSQERVTVNFDNISLSKALKDVEKKSNFHFVYSNLVLTDKNKITLHARDIQVEDLLKKLLENTGLTFNLMDNSLVVIKEATDLFDIIVKGKVTNGDGNPLEGVSVKIVGKKVGTATNAKGEYSLSVSENDKLEFSFVGFINQTVNVDNRKEIDLMMQESASQLNEVVVVGYGEQRKANVTSAISTVSAKDLGDNTYSNIGQALQGRAPGLFIRDEGYDQSLSFLVRGQTTIGNNGPLFIVDGVPADYNNVDPENIASISILKDASATAIYGARAAAGVILITTKVGKKGKATITYNTYYSWENPTVLPKSANSIQSANLMNEAALNSGASPFFTSDQINMFRTSNNLNYPDNNWPELLIKTQHRNKHYVNVNGGNENTQYLLSLSYLNSDGIFAKTIKDKEYNVQFNLSSKLRNNIETKVFVSLNRHNSTRPSINQMDNVYQHSLAAAPFLAIKDSTGHYASNNKAGSYSRGWWNPLWELEAGESLTETDVASVNASLTWEIIKGLKYIGRAAISTGNGRNTSYIYGGTSTDGPPTWPPETPQLSKANSFSQQLNAQNFLQYDKQFGDHSLSVLGGWDVEFDKSSSLSGARQGLLFNELITELSAPNSGDPNDILDLSSNTIKSVLQSAVGRINYNYQSKYLLEITARYDGSSIFAPETRYGFFPAVSAGWFLSKEKFFNVPNIDYLKIRGSYGTSGNNRVSGTYYSLMTFGSYYFDPNTVGVTAGEGSPAFRNLKWEKTTSANGGVDFSFYNGLISGSLDIYRKITNDILLPSPVPGTVGTNRNGPPINAGSVRNSGFEFVLNHENHIGNVHYNISLNGAYNKSKILTLTDAFSPYSTNYRVGDELGVIYGYKSGGIFKTADQAASYLSKTVTQGLSSETTAGDIIYKDLNGDQTLNFKDVIPIAHTLPRFTYAARLGASWKKFDIQIFLQGVAGVQGYYRNDLFGNYAWIPQEALNSLTQSNPNGNYPRPLLYGTKTYYQNFYTNSDFWSYNAAYLRVKNVQLGYNIPFNSKKILQSARLYLAATNLFTVQHYREGFDPESPTFATVPTLKTFSVGLNVNF